MRIILLHIIFFVQKCIIVTIELQPVLQMNNLFPIWKSDHFRRRHRVRMFAFAIGICELCTTHFHLSTSVIHSFIQFNVQTTSQSNVNLKSCSTRKHWSQCYTVWRFSPSINRLSRRVVQILIRVSIVPAGHRNERWSYFQIILENIRRFVNSRL